MFYFNGSVFTDVGNLEIYVIRNVRGRPNREATSSPQSHHRLPWLIEIFRIKVQSGARSHHNNDWDAINQPRIIELANYYYNGRTPALLIFHGQQLQYCIVANTAENLNFLNLYYFSFMGYHVNCLFVNVFLLNKRFNY